MIDKAGRAIPDFTSQIFHERPRLADPRQAATTAQARAASQASICWRCSL